MAEYTVVGERTRNAESALRLDGTTISVARGVRMLGATRAGAHETKIEIGKDDLIEVEFDNGFVLWTTIDRLEHDTRQGATRGAEGTLPTRYPTPDDTGERGFVGNVIRALKVLNYDLPKEGARAVAAKVEGQLAGEGFLRIARDGSLTPEAPAADNADKPVLVLIHGTASATANAYSGLFETNNKLWRELHDHYEGRVFGFEHRTLTQSPLQNAADLLDALPADLELHLVTHSRGGLVGDLIAHGQVQGDIFAPDDIERELAHAFGKGSSAFTEQRKLYRKYQRAIAAKRPRVTRFVRVGCPAAGTTLASGRLDTLFSILVNLANGIPGIGPFVAAFGELVAAVAKERTQTDALPGLEAQRPTSAFIRLLNSSQHVLESDLTVLAGDSDGFIKNLANLFFWKANDLVVDTRSMAGGATRREYLWHLEENRHVTHVNYFRRSETASLVQRALLRTDAGTAGYERRARNSAMRGEVDEGKPDEKVDQTGVVLLPGIMGSHLSVEDGNRRNRIWLDKSDIMMGRGKLLRTGAATVHPDGVLQSAYDDIRDNFVGHDLHVMPMAYDWRISLTRAADQLNALVRQRLEASSEPLHLLAHSMGGVVASLFIARHDDTWQRLRAGGGRLVQAGTPNRGSYVIPRIFQGTEKMLRMLAGLDFRADTKQWATWATGWQGVLELTPQFDDLDFSKTQTWKDFAPLAHPSEAQLRRAGNIWEILHEQTKKLADEDVLYVAGGPTETPIYDPTAVSDDKSGAHHVIRWTERGDGRVTWDSGIPPRTRTWYIPVKHGSLLNERQAFDGLRELVTTGATDKLASEPPPASTMLRSGTEDVPVLADDEHMPFIPSDEQLEAAALDAEDPTERRARRRRDTPPVTLSVVHGDLRFSRHPIMAGHYAGDPIVHAEAALDRCLDGALRTQHQLGLYPGATGTAEILLSPRSALRSDLAGPSGAIILGLGNVGELTPGALTRSIEAGLLRFAQAACDRPHSAAGLTVSTLLVGSGEAGLAVAPIIDALLDGVERTNRAIANLPRDDEGASLRQLSPIARIEIIELYHDIALEALHALRAAPARNGVTIHPTLIARSGGRRRARASAPAGWWTRLSIEASRDEKCADRVTLRFTSHGERARARVSDVCLQERLVSQVLAETMRNQASATGHVPQALFELLVPCDLKAGAADQRDIQLVLDETSASYPWELLVDRNSAGDRPIGIGAGMLRQLRVKSPPLVHHPENHSALVVGDPPSNFPALPGARREAQAVAATLSDRGWDVVTQIRSSDDATDVSASSVVRALLTHDARILHLAGHGIHDANDPRKSGLVLGGSPNDPKDPPVLVTVEEIAQMRTQPEVVFINCCHLGRIESNSPFPELASNLAAEFIRAGVKIVVAAGWAVDDRAAKTFSETFYEWMLGGADFGTAVRRAREATYDQFSESNTWGAYQCYGDPGFRLSMDLEVRALAQDTSRRRTRFVDPSEIAIALDNIVHTACVDTSDKEKEGLARWLESLTSAAEDAGWESDPDVLIGLARAHGELGNHEMCIALTERAQRLEAGRVTLHDIEQLANHRARVALSSRDAKLFERVIGDLEALITTHGATAERKSLLASTWKRFAILQISKDASRKAVRKAVCAMTQRYIEATALDAPQWFYPATNALLGVLLLGGPWARAPRKSTVAREIWDALDGWAKRETFETNLRRAEDSLPNDGHQDLWDALASPELAVVKALADDAFAKRSQQIAARYRSVLALYGSQREIGSVANNWDFALNAAKALDEPQLIRDIAQLQQLLQRP